MWKGLKVTNTVAYYGAELITTVKSFTQLVHGMFTKVGSFKFCLCNMALFYSSYFIKLHSFLNKLSYWSLASLRANLLRGHSFLFHSRRKSFLKTNNLAFYKKIVSYSENDLCSWPRESIRYGRQPRRL